MKDFCPVLRVPLLNLAIENGGEVVIVVVRAEMFLVIGLRRRALQAHAVQIPLGIRIVSDVIQGFEIVLRVHGGSPSGNRIETPMDKYSKLRIGVPLRKGMAPERLDGRIIMRGSLRAGSRQDESKYE